MKKPSKKKPAPKSKLPSKLLKQGIVYSSCSDSTDEQEEHLILSEEEPVDPLPSPFKPQGHTASHLPTKANLTWQLPFHVEQVEADVEPCNLRQSSGYMKILTSSFHKEPEKDGRVTRPCNLNLTSFAQAADLMNFQSMRRTLVLFPDDFRASSISDASDWDFEDKVQEIVDERNKCLSSLSDAKLQSYKREKTFGELFGASLPSAKELFHSEFFKFVGRIDGETNKMVAALQRKICSKKNGYFFDPSSEVVDSSGFRYTSNFGQNRIIKQRHSLRPETIQFQNFCLQFINGVIGFRHEPLYTANNVLIFNPNSLDTVDDSGKKTVNPEQVLVYPLAPEVKMKLLQQFRDRSCRRIVVDGTSLRLLMNGIQDRCDEEPVVCFNSDSFLALPPTEQVHLQQQKKMGDKIRDTINLNYLLDGKHIFKGEPTFAGEEKQEEDAGEVQLCISQGMKILDVVTQLENFFSNPQLTNLSAAFPRSQHRMEIKMILGKLNNILCDRLIDEQLEPIIIRFDNRDTQQAILATMKDPRYTSMQPQEFYHCRDKVYLTPNVLEFFDLKGLTDSSYLKLKIKFNATKAGFRLAQTTIGKYSPKNQLRFQDSPNSLYHEFISLRCQVGNAAWKKQAQSRLRDTAWLPKNPEVCKFMMEYGIRKVDRVIELVGFSLHHSHPLSLEYEKGMY